MIIQNKRFFSLYLVAILTLCNPLALLSAEVVAGADLEAKAEAGTESIVDGNSKGKGLLQKSSEAQSDKKYGVDIYGFVRSDLFFNSRASFAPCNELFYMFPYDEKIDPLGEDINNTSSSGFFSFVSRIGFNMRGPKVGRAETTAKIEVDFGGFGAYNTILRIRHAYVNLDWKDGNALLIGQSWHPLFGEVMPYVNNLSTGAPFQPFNRSPQLRYQYKTGGLKMTAAAICQFQYASNGPSGASNKYMINSCIPELYAGADYYAGGWQFGAGVDLLHLKPRTESTMDDGLTYKVDEMMSALTGEIHMRYHSKKLKVGAKSILGSALDYNLMVGGYGVTSVSGVNGEQEYTPFHHSTSWVNVTYGTVWRPLLFVGYTKNLGTSEALLSSDKIYGYGVGSSLDGDSNDSAIDEMVGTTIGFTYNKPSWSVGVEYTATTAWYGDINLSTGRVHNTHDVTNHRIAAQMSYYF